MHLIFNMTFFIERLDYQPIVSGHLERWLPQVRRLMKIQRMNNTRLVVDDAWCRASKNRICLGLSHLIELGSNGVIV